MIIIRHLLTFFLSFFAQKREAAKLSYILCSRKNARNRSTPPPQCTTPSGLVSGISSLEDSHTHIGLKNLDKRLEMLFGERARLKIGSVPNLCTTISFRLPITTDSDHAFQRRHKYGEDI